jgi:hypothetical protein
MVDVYNDGTAPGLLEDRGTLSKELEMKMPRMKLRFGLICSLAVLLMMPALLIEGQGARADTPFPQTGYSLWGPFETYWKAHGGLAQFGMPRTTVYSAGKDYDAQWFERALFTYNPSQPDPYKVELNLLGSQLTATRHNEGPFSAAKPGTQGTYFSVTGHNLSGTFLDYWQQTGGLPIYGYPISEPFMEPSKSDGKTYLVQYFERNRFEMHAELAGTKFEVQLGLLGSELLDLQGGPAEVAGAAKPAFYPAPSGGAVVPPGGIVPSPNAGTPGPGTTIPPAPALPATTKTILFSSDFSSADLSAWTPMGAYNPPDATGASWSVRNGILEQSGIAEEEAASTDALLLTNDSTFSDATLDSYFYAGGGEAAGLVTRYSDNGYYLLKIFASAPNSEPKARLAKVTPLGGEVTLATSSSWSGYKPGVWYRLTLTAKGNQLTAQVDGVQILSASDAQLSKGRLGPFAFADGRAKFDNFRVTGP